MFGHRAERVKRKRRDKILAARINYAANGKCLRGGMIDTPLTTLVTERIKRNIIDYSLYTEARSYFYAIRYLKQRGWLKSCWI